MNDESIWRAVHRMEEAAARFERAACQAEEAARRIGVLLEDGYGGNGVRLIELLEKQAAELMERTELERNRPFYLLRPQVFTDGNTWCVLYGKNLQEGVAGFGETPAKASVQFDIEWLNAKAGAKPEEE